MMTVPEGVLPPAEAYPGDELGLHSSGDASFVVRYLPESRLADASGYLFVSPGTPYNRISLPDMAFSAGFDGGPLDGLTQTLDDELGLHYGRPLTLSPDETVELVVDSPPQIARHQGYETAFLEMDSMTIEGRE